MPRAEPHGGVTGSGPWLLARALALPSSCQHASLLTSCSGPPPPGPFIEGCAMVAGLESCLGVLSVHHQAHTWPCRAPWRFGGAGAGAATANQWFEEALCSMSLFPPSFLLWIWLFSSQQQWGREEALLKGRHTQAPFPSFCLFGFSRLLCPWARE